jgi:hypothetical protein
VNGDVRRPFTDSTNIDVLRGSMQSNRIAQLQERLSTEVSAARENDDRWLLVHLSVKGDKAISLGSDSTFHSFEDSRELRGPRWRTLDSARQFADLGYSWVIAGELSAYLVFQRLLNKVVPLGIIMHVNAVYRWAPKCAEIVPTLNSVRGFLNPDLPENKGRAARRPGRVTRSRLTNSPCRICGSTENLTLHHVIPREAGGATEEENLLNVCRPCHESIHAGQLNVIDLTMEVSIKRAELILKSIQPQGQRGDTENDV